MKRLVLTLLVVMCAVIAVPSGAQAAGTDPVKGVFVAGGQRQWISCAGAGSPTVVVISGLGASSSMWNRVTPSFAKTSRTCVYDRPGLGKSPRRSGSSFTNANQHARELHALLAKAHETGPVILVAHSYAGLIARSYVRQFGEDVAGALLLDAVYPGIETNYLPSYRHDWNEGGTVIDMSASSAGAATTFGSIPLVVITAGDPEPGAPSWVIRLWNRMQDRAATLSTDSVHVVASASGHVVQNDQPAVVIKGVDELVRAVRNTTPLPACGRSWTKLGARCA